MGLVGREFGEWAAFSVQSDALGTEIEPPKAVDLVGPIYVYTIL
jgi:hypothetical protein